MRLLWLAQSVCTASGSLYTAQGKKRKVGATHVRHASQALGMAVGRLVADKRLDASIFT